MTCIDLFAGIGGFTLAYGSAGFETIAYSEIEPHAIQPKDPEHPHKIAFRKGTVLHECDKWGEKLP